MFNNFFFEYCALYVIRLKNIVEPGRPHDNKARAHCMICTNVYRHTSRTCDTYCMSTATVGCTNTPEYYVILTLTVLFLILEKCGSRSVVWHVHRFQSKWLNRTPQKIIIHRRSHTKKCSLFMRRTVRANCDNSPLWNPFPSQINSINTTSFILTFVVSLYLYLYLPSVSSLEVFRLLL